MKAVLEHVAIPDAELALERARVVVLTAFEERERFAHPRHRRRAVALAAAVLALLGGVLATPPGRAVLDEIREAVGVERAQPALFRLPTSGQLLVASDAGVWVVQADGSKRLLGAYREASWSPFGRFVVASKRNELAALEPNGTVRWTLARDDVRSPRWTGTRADTRIAYLTRRGIRVVAGDGRADRLLSPERAAIAWRPGSRFVLSQLHGSELRLQDTEARRVLDRLRAGLAADVLDLSWSADGRTALVVHPWELTLVDVTEDAPRSVPFPAGDVVAASFAPAGSRVAVVRRGGELLVLNGRGAPRPTRMFAARGELADLAWSPDGQWLAVAWPAADQWVFVRADGKRIRAVSNVSEQFRTRTFPRIEGWCCPE